MFHGPSAYSRVLAGAWTINKLTRVVRAVNSARSNRQKDASTRAMCALGSGGLPMAKVMLGARLERLFVRRAGFDGAQPLLEARPGVRLAFGANRLGQDVLAAKGDGNVAAWLSEPRGCVFRSCAHSRRGKRLSAEEWPAREGLLNVVHVLAHIRRPLVLHVLHRRFVAGPRKPDGVDERKGVLSAGRGGSALADIEVRGMHDH